MEFSTRLALQQRRIAVARENYCECGHQAELVIDRMRSPVPDQRSIDYLSGLAEAAAERLKEAFEVWNAEIDALSLPSADDLRDYSQDSGYRYEGDYRFWEPRDWSDLKFELASVGSEAMSRGELDNFNCSDIEGF